MDSLSIAVKERLPEEKSLTDLHGNTWNSSAVEINADFTHVKPLTETQKIDFKAERSKIVYDSVKRVFDVFGSLAGLIILFPLILFISVLIKTERSGKHVIYKQRRLGKNGKPIYIYKFRTMIDEADNAEKWLDSEQLKQYYNEYKLQNDPRITKIGKLLRRTGLDELPQLLNILKGELSIVGPRPIQEPETKHYGKDINLLLSIRPGLTGYWQAYCTDDTSYENMKRQNMELYYVRHRNMPWDIRIFFATFGAIVRKAKREQ